MEFSSSSDGLNKRPLAIPHEKENDTIAITLIIMSYRYIIILRPDLLTQPKKNKNGFASSSSSVDLMHLNPDA